MEGLFRRYAAGRGGQPRSMILVVGATGTVGRNVVDALADAGVPARALVRSEEKGRHARERGLEVAVGDLSDRASLDRALEGVERMFLVTPATEGQVALETSAIDAARDAGVRHVVKVSVVGADPDAPVRYSRNHGQIDEHLRRSGLAFTGPEAAHPRRRSRRLRATRATARGNGSRSGARSARRRRRDVRSPATPIAHTTYCAAKATRKSSSV
jgi:uncharacterized protein YbjT (DUF2867 family)